jgi:CBS-domain-containing membrane protein
LSAPASQPDVHTLTARRPLLQSLLATLCIVGIMLALDLLLQTAIVTTLGATTFIVFAMPNARPAQPRRLLSGYLAGAIAGVLCFGAAQ